MHKPIKTFGIGKNSTIHRNHTNDAFRSHLNILMEIEEEEKEEEEGIDYYRPMQINSYHI